MSATTVTKKLVKQLVKNFVNDKNDIFSNTKRRMSAVEDKTIDVIHAIVSEQPFLSQQEVKWKVEDLLKRVIELADKIGFVRLTYDLVLECDKK